MAGVRRFKAADERAAGRRVPAGSGGVADRPSEVQKAAIAAVESGRVCLVSTRGKVICLDAGGAPDMAAPGYVRQGARMARDRNRLASSSPMNRSASGSQRTLRFSSMQTLAA